MGKTLKPVDAGIPILIALGRKTTVLPGVLTRIFVYSLSHILSLDIHSCTD